MPQVRKDCSGDAGDLSELRSDGIAGNLDLTRVEPGMGFQRKCSAGGGAEMDYSKNTSFSKHLMRSHRLRQAYRLERNMSRRGDYRPSDFPRDLHVLFTWGGKVCFVGGLLRCHKSAQPAGNPRKGNRQDCEARRCQSHGRFCQQGVIPKADLAEPPHTVTQPAPCPAHGVPHRAFSGTVANLPLSAWRRPPRPIRLISQVGTRTSG